jgi:hypothetical protein
MNKKQTWLTVRATKVDKSTFVSGDFNIPCQQMTELLHRKSRPTEFHWQVEHRPFYSITAEYPFFPVPVETFIKIDDIWGHKVILTN